nr:amino acid adenylation domain-containing protein [Myxococcaceae bacterium MCy9487]
MELLSEVNRRGIKLWEEGNRLRFSAPQGVLSPELRNELAERKAELLELLHAAVELPRAEPDPSRRHEPFPLTDIQQAYWVGRAGAVDLGGVSTHVYFELEGRGLDVERLDRAWNRLVQRHEMLRAIILPSGQQQFLAQVPAYRIATSDMRRLGLEESTRRIDEARQQMSHQVLPTDQWPLFELRATLLPDERVRLHISIDVVIADGASMTRLFQEWSQLYVEPDHPLVPLELSFRDYVLAEERLRDTELYTRSRTYWMERLETFPSAPELPLASNPATLEKYQFQRRSARLEPAMWRQLAQRARKAGLTPSGLLMAAYAEVLATWSKGKRFVLNLTLFNRLPLHPQVNDIVGDFTSINLLEVDASLPGTFTDRATRLHQQLLKDMDHRFFGGVQVLRELARREGGIPRTLMPVVFTSGLALGSSGQGASALSELGTLVYGINQTPQVWLDLQVLEQDEGLAINWDAVEALFSPGMLDDMFAAYRQLLEKLACDEPAWTDAALCLTPAAQLARREAINATEAPLPDGLLHSAFLQQAEQRPQQPAILYGDVCLTYSEVATLATHLAHQLREAGVQPDTLVAVVMEKGWEQVVAVLGILMSGAAYLPVAAELPLERRRHLLRVGEVRVVVTQPWIEDSGTWPDGLLRLRVDRSPLALPPPAPLPPVQSPHHLAYVLFTSGSTGQPKGVMVDHRGALNTLLDINSRFRLGPSDRVLALSELGFDLSVFDIFGLLAVGGSLVLPDPALARDPSHWEALLRRHSITLWNSVPASMVMLASHLSGRSPPASLRLALLSGDWIPLSLPSQLRSLWPSLLIISLGGATEASIWSIFHPIDSLSPDWKSIPYGTPLTNQRFHVLDELLRPVPDWVPGQLFISGAGLALGYWRDEQRSSSSFFIHPRSGERLYRTGDLGRYWPHGSIEFLGREDFQVKVNGFRIELGEVEAALGLHPSLREAVVTAVGEPGASRRLVAHVVPGPGLSPSHASSQDERNVAEAAPLGENVLQDPVERLQFKLKQPGVRSFPPDTPSVALPSLEVDETLERAYLERQSLREFLNEPVALDALGQVLACLRQMPIPGAPLPKYRYPSAGSLYPVQAYLYVKPGRVKGLEEGLYYYHPVEHRLVKHAGASELRAAHYGEYNQAVFDAAAFSLLLIGQLDAVEPMYGALARDYCLIEAGYIGQLLMEQAPRHRLGLCPVGSFASEGMQDCLALSPRQTLLHSFVGGQIDPAALRTWMQPRPSHGSAAEPQLREFLRKKLPDYMIPTSWVLWEALPRTPNGKIDRKALSSRDANEGAPRAPAEAPRNPLERRLLALWSELLGTQALGIRDSFFMLGGDSLLATRLVASLREQLGVDVPLATFFRTPTVAGIAEYVDLLQWAASANSTAALAGDAEEVEL